MWNIIKLSILTLTMAALATALPPHSASAHAQQAVVVGVDVTVEQFEAAAICDKIAAWVERHSDDGAFICVVAVTGQTFVQPTVLAEVQLPDHPGIKKKARRRALHQFRQDLAGNLAKRHSYPKAWFKRSQILDFFKLAGHYFEQHRIPKAGRKLMLISDMLQVDEKHNWEKHDAPETNGIHLPHIGGTLAVHHVQSSRYPSSDKWERVRAAWLELLSRAGIKVVAYSSALP